MARSFNPRTIQLPVQTLDLALIANKSKLRKIFLQFDVIARANGTKSFGLAAYPAYKNGNSWTIGKRIPLKKKPGSKVYKLKLPLTLGNLELKRKDLQKLLKAGTTSLTFKPFLYSKNAHAAYSVTDDSTQTTVDANPTPPGKPSES